MCQNDGIIISLLILKIIAIIVLPAIIIYFSIRKFENYKRIVFVEIVLLLLLITVSILSNDCAVNSSVFKIKDYFGFKEEHEIIKESNDVSVVEEIQSTDRYKVKGNQKVFYFNNNTLPLSDKKIGCGSKDLYFKNIGSNITAISMLLSTELKTNVDPIKLLNLSLENEIFDCDTGVDVDDLFAILKQKYNVNTIDISKEEAINNINTGKIVLAEVTNDPSLNNVTCEDSYIILYKLNKEGNFMILNPNDRDYDYICPENSDGYGTIIEANTNDRAWTASNITSLVTRYIIMER